MGIEKDIHLKPITLTMKNGKRREEGRRNKLGFS